MQFARAKFKHLKIQLLRQNPPGLGVRHMLPKFAAAPKLIILAKLPACGRVMAESVR